MMKMRRKLLLPIAIAACVAVAAPAIAAITLKAANLWVAVARSGLTVKPDQGWNKIGRPGRNAESWTLDGLPLNELTFYGGVLDGKTLFREVDKTNSPLPKFSKTMLAPDIAQLFEGSYRIAMGTSQMSVDSMEPASFAGTQGFRFTYSFSQKGEEVKRKGEARGAIIDGRLYMATFEAPRIHYFDRDIGSFRAIADSAKLAAVKK